MRDAETGEQLFVDTHDRGFLENASRLLAERREQELRATFQQAGVDTLELSHRRRSCRCDFAFRRLAQTAQPIGRGRRSAAST